MAKGLFYTILAATILTAVYAAPANIGGCNSGSATGCTTCWDTSPYTVLQSGSCKCVPGAGTFGQGCFKCSIYQYSPGGNARCTSCPSGKIAAKEMSISVDACSICTTSNGTGCSSCRSGLNLAYDARDKTCKCASGYYDKGDGTCGPCAKGTWSSRGFSKCTACEAGKTTEDGLPGVTQDAKLKCGYECSTEGPQCSWCTYESGMIFDYLQKRCYCDYMWDAKNQRCISNPLDNGETSD